MKTKNMKKALSLFLAVLMIALALPLTLLSVSAESQPTAVEFTSVALHAQDGEGTAISFTGANAIDGKLDDGKYYSTTSSKDVAKRAYFNNGAIDYKENGDYYGIIVAELAQLTAIDTFTVWSPNGKKNGWLDNQAYEIWYSVDGTTFVNSNVAIADADNAHTPVDASAFPGEVGSYGITSDGSGLEGKIYKNEMDMNGIEAKYIAIAVTETTTVSEKIVVWEITATGTSIAIPVSVAGIQQGADGVRIVGVTDSMDIAGVGFKLDVTYIEEDKNVTYTTESTNIVYDSILAAGKKVTAKDIDSTLYDEDDKLYALGITGIPTTGTVILEVTPYFIRLNSTMIYGATATFDFVDGKALNKSETVKVMSYNICNGQVGNKVLSTRLDYIAAQINSVDPDVVVLNEAHNYDPEYPNYDITISELTDKCGVSYGIVDFVNEKATNVILYNTDKYTLVSSEVITLTNLDENGDNVGDKYERTAVFARLKRISDNREFAVAGIHLDLTHEVAKMQAWQVNDQLAENYGDIRHIVAGDFNFTSPAHDAENGSNIVHTNPLIKEGYTDVNVGVDGSAT